MYRDKEWFLVKVFGVRPLGSFLCEHVVGVAR